MNSSSILFKTLANNSLVNLSEALHDISQDDAETIVNWYPERKYIVLRQTDKHTLQMTYIACDNATTVTLKYTDDDYCSVTDQTTEITTEYKSIKEAMAAVAGNDAVVLNNLDYANNKLKELTSHQVAPLNFDNVIKEILDISTAYSLAVMNKCDIAENIHAHCLALQFKLQQPELDKLSLIQLHERLESFEALIGDDLETDYTRYTCYSLLADLFILMAKNNPDQSLHINQLAWYCFCQAKTYMPTSETQYQKTCTRYWQHTLQMVDANSTQTLTMREIQKLSGFSQFSENMSDFMLQLALESWKKENSEADEIRTCLAMLKKLTDNVDIFKELGANQSLPIIELKKLNLADKSFKTIGDLVNYLIKNLPIDTFSSDIIDKLLGFVTENSIYLKRNFIFNFTQFDDNPLLQKKFQGNYCPILFNKANIRLKDSNNDVDSALNLVRPNDTITIDAHGDGKSISIKVESKIEKVSPENLALALSKRLSKSKLGNHQITINLICCKSAGSTCDNIDPENSFAYKLCASLKSLNIQSKVIARFGDVSVDKTTGRKTANDDYHSSMSKFQFEANNQNEMLIHHYDYKTRTWKEHMKKAVASNSLPTGISKVIVA